MKQRDPATIVVFVIMFGALAFTLYDWSVSSLSEKIFTGLIIMTGIGYYIIKGMGEVTSVLRSIDDKLRNLDNKLGELSRQDSFQELQQIENLLQSIDDKLSDVKTGP